MDNSEINISETERILEFLGKSKVPMGEILKQIQILQQGTKFISLNKPATINDGIIKIQDNDIDRYTKLFYEGLAHHRFSIFIPASGAATRMFKKLLKIYNELDFISINSLIKLNTSEANYTIKFIENLDKFPFFNDLTKYLPSDLKPPFKKDVNLKLVLKYLLFEEGLNYSNKPKACILFHNYNNQSRTAFEDQVNEALEYLKHDNTPIDIHFTISEEHETLFKELIDNITGRYFLENIYLDITYSFQKSSTNSITLNLDNTIFRNEDDNPVFHPSGHGALLENLNDLDQDIVFIKNIDNVIHKDHLEKIILTKKLLGGLFIDLQAQIFSYLNKLERGLLLTNELDDVEKFCKDKLSINLPEKFNSFSVSEKMNILKEKLNRPIRVCGMIKRNGSPGGGPFWINEDEKNISLQIVESAQINMNDQIQKSIFENSTHFNPVDMVVGLKDFNGNNFNLLNYRDINSGFISYKSRNGIELKSYELPGLWNGGMNDWITIFVEIPNETFAPVKELNDLLNNEHQPKVSK